MSGRTQVVMECFRVECANHHANRTVEKDGVTHQLIPLRHGVVMDDGVPLHENGDRCPACGAPMKEV